MNNIDNFVWSFSRINSFINGCKYAWKLQYLDGIPSENNFFGEYGSYMHSILEKYSKNELLIFELSDYYKQHYHEMIIHSAPPNDYVDLDKKYFQKGLEYLNSFDGFDKFGNIILGVEKEVKFKIDNYDFIGYIDLLIKNNNNDIIMIDHKSKSAFKSKKELSEYLRQLYIYSIPVEQEYGKLPKKLIFNMFREGIIVEKEFNIKDYQEAKTWAIQSIEKIKQETEFKPKIDDFFCSHICGYRHQCPYHYC